ncbi:MAG: methylmalonyl-CoA epimerase [Elusimicrobiota bacterium]
MKLDHVGIAVRDIERAAALYKEAFGLEVTHREDVPAQHVRVAFLGDPEDPDGAAQVELLEPMGDEGAVARFLASRGPGMHHLAFRAGDVAAEMDRLRRTGHPPIEDKPRPGSRGHSVCFVHPRHAGGALIELVGER